MILSFIWYFTSLSMIFGIFVGLTWPTTRIPFYRPIPPSLSDPWDESPYPQLYGFIQTLCNASMVGRSSPNSCTNNYLTRGNCYKCPPPVINVTYFLVEPIYCVLTCTTYILIIWPLNKLQYYFCVCTCWWGKDGIISITTHKFKFIYIP